MQRDLVFLLLLAVVVSWVWRYCWDIDWVGDFTIERVIAGLGVVGPHVRFLRFATFDNPDEGRLLCNYLYDLSLPLEPLTVVLIRIGAAFLLRCFAASQFTGGVVEGQAFCEGFAYRPCLDFTANFQAIQDCLYIVFVLELHVPATDSELLIRIIDSENLILLKAIRRLEIPYEMDLYFRACDKDSGRHVSTIITYLLEVNDVTRFEINLFFGDSAVL